MVGGQFQVGGERRFFFDKIQQIVGGSAWGANPFAGEIIPNGKTGGAARANAGLAFIAVCSCQMGLFEFMLDFIFKVIHGRIIIREGFQEAGT